MKVIVCAISRLVLLCVISGVLGAIGFTLHNWQFWAIFFGALGLHACGLLLGEELNKTTVKNDIKE